MNDLPTGKDWWRKTRLPIIEAIASKEIARYEKRISKIDTAVIPVDKFIEKLWGYELLYDNPAKYGAVPGALAALRPDLKLVIISDEAGDQTRLEWNAAHEGAHILLHIPYNNESTPPDIYPSDDRTDVRSSKRSIFCRNDSCGFADGPEHPYMYREAEYFAGCLLMSRERYEPLAAHRFTEALDECLDRTNMRFQDIESNEGLRIITYTQVIESALNKMVSIDLNNRISRQAQMIRLSSTELGLVSQISGMNYPSFGYSKKVYEFSERMAAMAARNLGLDYSPEWRMGNVLLKGR